MNYDVCTEHFVVFITFCIKRSLALQDYGHVIYFCDKLSTLTYHHNMRELQ
jgi:hypothetical protein